MSVILHQIQFGSEPAETGPPTKPVRDPGPKLAAGVLPVKVLLDAREPETQRVWEPRLRRRLESSGFTGVRLYGDLEGSPYGPEALRLVALARKPGQSPHFRRSLPEIR